MSPKFPRGILGALGAVHKSRRHFDGEGWEGLPKVYPPSKFENFCMIGNLLGEEGSEMTKFSSMWFMNGSFLGLSQGLQLRFMQ